MVDPHLLHLWEARRGLAKRWQRNKCNRKLKIRISKLIKETQEYFERLERKNWRETCNKLQGTLSSKRTWAVLKALLSKKEDKNAAKQKVQRLIHNHPGKEEDIIKEVNEKFLGTEQNITVDSHFDEYQGNPNIELDRPFTEAEIERALSKLTRNTAPGYDRINKRLRNLDGPSVDALLKYINECWEHGKVPPEWKHAEVTTIPKLNKPISVQRAACGGKLEHMVHNRMIEHLEDNGHVPNTMFGFRAHLSTQDVLLQINEKVIDKLDTHSKRAILELDVKGAFDNVSHEAILQHLNVYSCGGKYIITSKLF